MKNIIWLAIMLLPYDSFGMIGGHLRPISTPVLLLLLCLFLLNHNQIVSRGNVCDKQFFKIVASFVFVSIIGAVNSMFQNFVYNPDGETPVLRLLQFMVFILITVGAYIAGKVASGMYVPARLLELILQSFILPCIFGLIQIITNNHSVVIKISSVISAGVYPEGYGRIWLLFSEPNIAGVYLSGIIIPIVLCTGLLSGWVKIIVFGLACIELYCTRSITGYILFAFAILVIFLGSSKYNKLLFLLALIIVPVIVLISLSLVISGNEMVDARILKLASILIDGGLEAIEAGEIESSAASRYISQFAAIRVGLENPLFGIGFRQFGFYYPSFVPDTYFFSEEFRSILFGSATFRLTDVKSFHLDIFSSCGFLITAYFFYWQFRVFKKISSLGSLESKEVAAFKVIYLLVNIGGFISIPMIGLPFIWFLSGYISNGSDVKNMNKRGEVDRKCLHLKNKYTSLKKFSDM